MAYPYPNMNMRERCGNRSGKLLLSFDDWNEEDPYVATRTGEFLRDQGITALYFLINKYAKDYPDIVETLRRQGHYVGNHSYSHARLTDLTDAQVRTEISDGVKSNVLRPPYIAWDERVRAIAMSLGYSIVTWSITSGDYLPGDGPAGLRSVDQMRDAVKRASDVAKLNGLIIGHLYTNFPDAIPAIVADMRAERRQFYPNKGPVGVNFPARFR